MANSDNLDSYRSFFSYFVTNLEKYFDRQDSLISRDLSEVMSNSKDKEKLFKTINELRIKSIHDDEVLKGNVYDRPKNSLTIKTLKEEFELTM